MHDSHLPHTFVSLKFPIVMILFQNSIARLDYDPATDVAIVEYPDLHGYLLGEIKYSIDLLVQAIRNYDVRLLMLDSSRTVISVSPEESREIAVYLAARIMTTRVRKVARVQSGSETVEQVAQDDVAYVTREQALPFQVQTFPGRTEAAVWLTV